VPHYLAWDPETRALALSSHTRFEFLNAAGIADEIGRLRQMQVYGREKKTSPREELETARRTNVLLHRELSDYRKVIDSLHSRMKAGLLLMQAVLAAKIKKHGPDLTLVGAPRVDVDRLSYFVDPAMADLKPDTLRLLAERIADIMEDEILAKARVSVYDEKEMVDMIAESAAQDVDKQVTADLASWKHVPGRKRGSIVSYDKGTAPHTTSQRHKAKNKARR